MAQFAMPDVSTALRCAPKKPTGWVASSSAAWRWYCPFAIAKALGLDDATRKHGFFPTPAIKRLTDSTWHEYAATGVEIVTLRFSRRFWLIFPSFRLTTAD